MLREIWSELNSNKSSVDLVLLLLIFALVSLGLTMVLSASLAISEARFEHPWHYFLRQGFSAGLGLVLGLLVFAIPADWWRLHRGKLFLVALFLLVLVLFVGREIGGAKRWLPLVIMNFQPAEFLKIAIIIFIAGYLERHLSAVREHFSAVLRLSLPLGIMAFLLLMQPDYGTTALIAGIVAGMLFIAGAPFRYFIYSLAPIALLFGSLIWYSPYRLARLSSFMNPWEDPFASGYQLTQALIASGSGGWFGSGLGGSVQKLLYLPDAHTDFLFSIFAEEFGFIGVTLLLIIFALLIVRIFKVAKRSQEQGEVFAPLMVYGIGIWIVLQALINIGMNLGFLPTKGLTLPFISYGGSSLMIMGIALALVLRVDFEARKRERAADAT